MLREVHSQALYRNDDYGEFYVDVIRKSFPISQVRTLAQELHSIRTIAFATAHYCNGLEKQIEALRQLLRCENEQEGASVLFPDCDQQSTLFKDRLSAQFVNAHQSDSLIAQLQNAQKLN